jgi:hypothetical protein
MVRPCCIAYKSTGRQPAGQLAPRDVPPQQEMQHDSPQHVPQEEEPFEIELAVPGSLGAQGTPIEEEQHQQDHDEDKDDEEYSPLSDTEGEKLYRDAKEIESFGAEAPVSIGRLQALLGHLGFTSAPKYRIKGILHLWRVEFKAVLEIFQGPKVINRHTGPAYRASNSDAMADAA